MQPKFKYICASCNKEFESEWTDEEARAELAVVYGPNFKPEDCIVVCDDCYGDRSAQ